jgi:proteasome beta subunit
MTVVLAVRCTDGIVICADSQITDSARGMSYPAQKLHPLGDFGAWGGSGARAVLTDFQRDLASSASTIEEAEDVAHALQDRFLPILKHHYDRFIPEVPGEGSAGGTSAYVLAAGYSGGEPFIVEINPQAMASRYEDIGFHAIGSGAPSAQQAGILLAHYDLDERTMDHGVVMAVRVLDALRVTVPSVGLELDVARITPDGVRHLDDDEIDDAREIVREWGEAEQSALDDILAKRTGADAEG